MSPPQAADLHVYRCTIALMSSPTRPSNPLATYDSFWEAVGGDAYDQWLRRCGAGVIDHPENISLNQRRFSPHDVGHGSWQAGLRPQ